MSAKKTKFTGLNSVWCSLILINCIFIVNCYADSESDSDPDVGAPVCSTLTNANNTQYCQEKFVDSSNKLIIQCWPNACPPSTKAAPNTCGETAKPKSCPQ